MRALSLSSLSLVAAIAVGCNKSPAPAATPAPSPLAAPQAAAAPVPTAIHGKVQEKVDASGYSYLRLAAASGDVWVAVPVATVAVGAEVDVAGQMTMDNFESKTLNRKFDKLVFGTLTSGAPAAAPAAATPAPGQFAMGADKGQNPHAAAGLPAPSGPAPTNVKVEKAKGADARTVAEVWGQKAKLKDQPVTVRGTVVKYNAGIMGKNWLHLKDGSGSADKKDDDLAVTTLDAAAVGDVVTIKGPVHLDKDFGAGYFFAVIVEDAKLEKK